MKEYAIDEIRELLEGDSWAPMENFPKDGEPFLVSNSAGDVGIARWKDTSHFKDVVVEVNGHRRVVERRWVEEGYLIFSEVSDGWDYAWCWQPLPGGRVLETAKNKEQGVSEG